jgi:hypothetical protein
VLEEEIQVVFDKKIRWLERKAWDGDATANSFAAKARAEVFTYFHAFAAACRRSYCQRLRIEGVTWLARRIPTAVFSASRPEQLLLLTSTSSVILTRLSGPRSRPITSQEIW